MTDLLWYNIPCCKFQWTNIARALNIKGVRFINSRFSNKISHSSYKRTQSTYKLWSKIETSSWCETKIKSERRSTSKEFCSFRNFMTYLIPLAVLPDKYIIHCRSNYTISHPLAQTNLNSFCSDIGKLICLICHECKREPIKASHWE